MLSFSVTRRIVVMLGSLWLLASLCLASIQEGQSTFRTPEKDLAFGFTIPNNTATKARDMYFTILADVTNEWAAIGLGSHDMKACLVLMIYKSADGKKVTLSQRTSNDFIEPLYDSSLEVETLASEVKDGMMKFSGRCSNCRSWNGGWLDASSQTVKGCYATGPSGSFRSDNKAESVRFHDTYGAFLIDLHHATGAAGAPDLDKTTDVLGTQQLDERAHGKLDYKSIIHALIMIVVFAGLMPFGLVLLRAFHSVKWHWINQTVALLGALVGAVIGITDSLLYRRTRGFNSAHQIIGFIVMILALAQWTLGFLHHRAYKRTQKTTKMAPVHVWLGRLLMVFALVNGFLGFPLALKPVFNWAMGAAVVLGLGMMGFFYWKKGVFSGRNRASPKAVASNEPYRHTAINEGGRTSGPYDGTNYDNDTDVHLQHMPHQHV